MPFVGIIDKELNILIKDCNPKQHVNPTIDIIIKGSCILSSLSKRRIIIVNIKVILGNSSN